MTNPIRAAQGVDVDVTEWDNVIAAARTALSAPVGEGPSDAMQRLLAAPMDARGYVDLRRPTPPAPLPAGEGLPSDCGYEAGTMWTGHPAPQPPAEGEVGELVAALGSKDRWTQLTDAQVDRAATLLSQLSAPAPAVAPVPVSERLPGRGETVRKGDDDWAWGQERSLLTGRSAPRWRLMRVSCLTEEAVNWLPSHAISLPQAGEVEP